MNFIKRFTVLIYVTIIMFISCSLIMFALQFLDLDNVITFVDFAYIDQNLRVILGVLAGILLILNFIFFRIYSINIHRDKMIAFDNPGGRVTVSLTALEDLVKKTVSQEYEVKDIKANIFATRKGLQVKIKLVLSSEFNVPEVASKVQASAKNKIQDIIGLEEKINVSIYVSKILPEPHSKKEKKESKVPTKEGPTNIPFQGYRA